MNAGKTLFAQLTCRESLRDIETCLSVHASNPYHMGFRQPVRRSMLADANETRDWRLYAAFAQRLIAQARKLYAEEELGLDPTNTVYALDSTTIAPCLSVFPWSARPRRRLRCTRCSTCGATFRVSSTITNNFFLPAATIGALYKSRWQVELFFKWIKQRLRIKQFYGTSENAVKTQIWIAVSVYLIVAIIKKRLDPDASLYALR